LFSQTLPVKLDMMYLATTGVQRMVPLQNWDV